MSIMTTRFLLISLALLGLSCLQSKGTPISLELFSNETIIENLSETDQEKEDEEHQSVEDEQPDTLENENPDILLSSPDEDDNEVTEKEEIFVQSNLTETFSTDNFVDAEMIEEEENETHLTEQTEFINTRPVTSEDTEKDHHQDEDASYSTEQTELVTSVHATSQESKQEHQHGHHPESPIMSTTITESSAYTEDLSECTDPSHKHESHDLKTQQHEHRKWNAQSVTHLMNRLVQLLEVPKSDWKEYRYVTALRGPDGSLYVPQHPEQNTRRHLATLLGFADEIIVNKNALAELDEGEATVTENLESRNTATTEVELQEESSTLSEYETTVEPVLESSTTLPIEDTMVNDTLVIEQQTTPDKYGNVEDASVFDQEEENSFTETVVSTTVNIHEHDAVQDTHSTSSSINIPVDDTEKEHHEGSENISHDAFDDLTLQETNQDMLQTRMHDSTEPLLFDQDSLTENHSNQINEKELDELPSTVETEDTDIEEEDKEAKEDEDDKGENEESGDNEGSGDNEESGDNEDNEGKENDEAMFESEEQFRDETLENTH